MWSYFTLLSFKPLAKIAKMKQEVLSGRNQPDFRVEFAQRIATRFHDARAAEKALEDFNQRAKGGLPYDIPKISLTVALIYIGELLKQANLVPSTSEAMSNIEQSGVKIDGANVFYKVLKVEAVNFAVQVGKRKFAKITLS